MTDTAELIDDPVRRYFAIVPAAGVGKRVGSSVPKQYICLQGKTILEHTLTQLLAVTDIEKIVVPVGAEDKYWQSLTILDQPRIDVVIGGQERCHSVLAGLQHLTGVATAQDWILVHDVARPCIHQSSVERLMGDLVADDVGGILAVPATDTMKQVDSHHHIHSTFDRTLLWHAQTPQMFPFVLLREAIEKALEAELPITDEASAIEFLGLKPKVIEGLRSNIKVTRPEDIALAEYFLQQT